MFKFFLKLSQKRGTIIKLTDRAILLFNPDFHDKNLTSIINILLENDYSLKLIFDTINSRVKNIMVRNTELHDHSDEVNDSSIVPS